MSDEVQRSLGRVEAKVDILLERTDAYDNRISSIEKKVWWASGASAVIAFIAARISGAH